MSEKLTREGVELLRESLGEYGHGDGRWIPTPETMRALCDLALAGLATEWVPVSERLPERGVEVLIYVPDAKFNRVDMDSWDEIREAPVSWSSQTIPVGEGWGNHEFAEVSHWQPLPSAPSGDKP